MVWIFWVIARSALNRSKEREGIRPALLLFAALVRTRTRRNTFIPVLKHAHIGESSPLQNEPILLGNTLILLVKNLLECIFHLLSNPFPSRACLREEDVPGIRRTGAGVS